MDATAERCAHLLLQVDAGRAEEVAQWVAALPHVQETAVTSGPYDVIVRVPGEALPRVLALTRRAPGLAGVRVCRPV